MDELFANGVIPQTLAGYGEIWYCCETKMHKGIQIPEADIMFAIHLPKFKGLQMGFKESKNSVWRRPFDSVYGTVAYLFDSSVVVINELKKQDAVGLRSSPKYVVSLMSQSKDGLQKAASRLKLPLEELV